MTKEWYDRTFAVGDRIRIYCHEHMRGVITEEAPTKGYGWRVKFDDGTERHWIDSGRLLHDVESKREPDWNVVGPDLLRALKACLAPDGGLHCTTENERAARAAIAKATP